MARTPDPFSIIAVVIAVLCACFVFAGSARADMIEMKDGRFYEGEILEETDEHVVVQLKNRTARLKKSKIVTIHKTKAKRPARALGPAAKDAPANTSGVETVRKPRSFHQEIPANASNFTRSVLKSRTPIVVVFTAEWCGVCKQQEPIIRKVAGEYRGKVKVEYVDIDRRPAIAAEYQIRGVPSVIAARDGKFVDGWSGGVPASKLRKTFAKLAGIAPAAQPTK